VFQRTKGLTTPTRRPPARRRCGTHPNPVIDGHISYSCSYSSTHCSAKSQRNPSRMPSRTRPIPRGRVCTGNSWTATCRATARRATLSRCGRRGSATRYYSGWMRVSLEGPSISRAKPGRTCSCTPCVRRNGSDSRSRLARAPAGLAVAVRGSGRNNRCNTSSPARSRSGDPAPLTSPCRCRHHSEHRREGALLPRPVQLTAGGQTIPRSSGRSSRNGAGQRHRASRYH
jgi:hypothetical protein